MLNATTPLWTIVVALAVRHQKVTWLRQAVGLVIGFAGTLLIFQPWQSSAGIGSTGGIECIAASICYGISYVSMDHFLARRGISPITLSACQLLAATLWLAVVLAFTGAPGPRLTGTTIVSMAVLGFAGTGIAYVLNYQIITSEGATIASTVTYLLPDPA
jgi:drug/metabolite transporter (DMT)-like permease